jgi:hypothetical protein
MSYVDKHVHGDVCDLVLACIYGIAHYELRAPAVSSFSHACAYSLWEDGRGDEGAQHIAAARTQVSAVYSVLA